MNEEKISRNLFISKEELKEMSAAGIELGSHSHGHYVMTGDNEEALRKDIQLSKKIIEEISGVAPRVFSYPHGRVGEMAEQVVK